MSRRSPDLPGHPSKPIDQIVNDMVEEALDVFEDVTGVIPGEDD